MTIIVNFMVEQNKAMSGLFHASSHFISEINHK